MIKILRLNKSAVGFDNTPVIFGKDDELTIEILSEYDLSNAVMTLRNGKTTKIQKIEDSKVTVPQEIMFSGWLSIAVEMFLGGEIVKKWQNLPLKIVESTPEVVAEEILQVYEYEIKALKANKADLTDLEELKTMLYDLADKHNKLTEIVKLIKEV